MSGLISCGVAWFWCFFLFYIFIWICVNMKCEYSGFYSCNSSTCLCVCSLIYEIYSYFFILFYFYIFYIYVRFLLCYCSYTIFYSWILCKCEYYVNVSILFFCFIFYIFLYEFVWIVNKYSILVNVNMICFVNALLLCILALVPIYFSWMLCKYSGIILMNVDVKFLWVWFVYYVDVMNWVEWILLIECYMNVVWMWILMLCLCEYECEFAWIFWLGCECMDFYYILFFSFLYICSFLLLLYSILFRCIY